MEDDEAQNDEILALQSIFDDTQIHVDSCGQQKAGRIYVKPELCDGKLTVQADKNGHLVNIIVEYLCPIELHFNIPSDYPSTHPPSFTLVCKWLRRDQLTRLCQKMDEMWENDLKGQVVLFEWIQFLQYEAAAYLGVKDSLDLSWAYHQPPNKSTRTSLVNQSETNGHLSNASANSLISRLDSRAVLDNQLKMDLIDFIVEYDKSQKQVAFDKAVHACKVCFEEKLGSQCIQFANCNHVYCKDCMRGYFEVKIADGMVNGLVCPEDKCTSQASPGQVKELVGQELFARYDSLLLQSTLASMLNLTYCPRPACQYPVSCEPGTSMGSCPLCSFHFCLLCKASFHGIAPCAMNAEDKLKLYEAYMNGGETEKESLECRYGKKQLMELIDNFQAESWIDKHSKKCPHCGAPIEKKDGCNKMSCPRCSTYFCWLCLAQLDPNHPYLHFSSSMAKCDLFEGLVNDEDDERDDWINLNEDSEDEFSDD